MYRYEGRKKSDSLKNAKRKTAKKITPDPSTDFLKVRDTLWVRFGF